jgi:hypothetical protein
MSEGDRSRLIAPLPVFQLPYTPHDPGTSPYTIAVCGYPLEPPERLLPGGEALVKIGEEVSEHIDRRPASLVRVQVIRPKYKVPGAAAATAAEVADPESSASETGSVSGRSRMGQWGVDGEWRRAKLPPSAPKVPPAGTRRGSRRDLELDATSPWSTASGSS